MAARPTWKGYLRLSLVSCPVRLYNAVSHRAKTSFHLLHKGTHNRIQMRPYDPELGVVDRSDLVKGYQHHKSQYVLFTDADIKKIKIASDKAIVIDKFIDAEYVDPIYFEWPYYVAPDGAVAEETFRVIQWAMREKKKVALCSIVLSERRRPIALICRDKGFLMMTLRAANEVRSSAEYFVDIKDEEPDREMLDLAGKLIEQKSGKFDPSELRDRYQEAVLEMVEAKVKGRAPVVARAPEPGKVINLMDALRRSLEESRPPAESKPRTEAGNQAEFATGNAKRRRKAG
jgi:DNA end-binding protein Ku